MEQQVIVMQASYRFQKFNFRLELIRFAEVMELRTGLDFKELGLNIYQASRLPQSISIHELAHKSL